MSQVSRIGFVIFGLGRAGHIHAKNLIRNPQASLKRIVDIDESKAKEFVTANFADTKVVTRSGMETVLSDPSVNAAVITTTTHLHEEIIMRCLQAGKAVFCEKPVASTIDQIESCCKLAESHDIPLLCAFNRRFDPTIRSVKDRVRNDDIGKVHVIKTTSRDSPLPSMDFLKKSGGYFHDCCVHDVDVICWIMGQAPYTVFCLGHAFHSEIGAINDVDTVGIVMKFPSGAIGQIDLSRHSGYGYDQRVEVFGASGMLTSDNCTALSSTYFHAGGSTKNPIKFSFPQRYAEAFDIEMNHLQCDEEERKPACFEGRCASIFSCCRCHTEIAA